MKQVALDMENVSNIKHIIKKEEKKLVAENEIMNLIKGGKYYDDYLYAKIK